jgi:hypothetical protein
MIATCARSGWRAATANGKLVLTVWLWNGLLALVAGVATWRWLDAALAHAVEGDRLLERFHVGLAVELMQYDRFSPITSVNGAVLGLILLAAISNPLLSAGVLEGIVASDGRPVLHRFFRGAGHFFGRFLRLLVISALAAVVLVLLTGAVTRPVVEFLSDSSWERTWVAASLVRTALLLMVVVLVAVILDVARAQVVTARVETRGMLRAWADAARYVFRHFGTVATFGLAYVGLLVVMLGAYLLVASVLPGQTWAAIVALILWQQAFMIGRAGMRVARAGAALQFCRKTTEVSEPVLQS